MLNGPAALRRKLIRDVIAPGDDAEVLMGDEDALDSWVRARAVPFYHPVGTCRMGDVRRRQGGCRRRMPGARRRGLTGDRCLDHADDPAGEHEPHRHYDRRENGRGDDGAGLVKLGPLRELAGQLHNRAD